MPANQKARLRKQFLEARQVLRDVMQKGLGGVAEQVVYQLTRRWTSSTPAQRPSLTKEITLKGVGQYRVDIQTAFAVIALDSIERARREVPKARNVKLCEHIDSVKLAEWDRLPPRIRRQLKRMSELLVETQIADLEKAVYFQYSSSWDTTDSQDLLFKDLHDAAEDFITGSSVGTGSGTVASQIINTSRNGFFFDKEVLEEVEAFQFINGDPVSPICQDLAGTIFAKDDPMMDRYTPPLHFNCKSYIVPILTGNLKSREIQDLRPSSRDLEKFVQLAERSSCGCPDHGLNS